MSGHIVLIGLSGSGKSTVAQLLAQALGRPVYDTDALLAAERAHLYAACAHEALDTDGLSPGEVAQRILATVADGEASHAL